VADVVALCAENRILVRHGLERLGVTSSVGLQALKTVSGLRDSLRSYHLGFVLGPRLNAAGRMGRAETALRLLLTDDPGEARELAASLDAANRQRKRVENAILEEAESDLADGTAEVFGIVAGRAGWHVGTVGIVAARLCQRYYRPAVVIGFEEGDTRGRGSCRSIETIDLMDVLEDCSDFLVSFGGHRAAAGLVIERTAVAAFRERFDSACRQRCGGRLPEPVHTVDAWLDSLGEADWDLFTELQRLRPFGAGNPTPTWGLRGVRLAGPPRPVGQDHLRMTVASGGSQIDGIAFGMAQRRVPEGPMDILFHLQDNTYLGTTRLQLNIRDFRPHSG
jgi:single-stranded-DNA-specific exonuclease